MLPSYYEFFNPVKLISGNKAIDNLPYELEQLGAGRPIIITDKGVTDAGLVKIVIQAFESSDMVIGAVFDDVPQDSSSDIVNRIAGIYRENTCDSIVAVGGGSPIDTAKGVNIVITENSDDLMKFEGADRLNKPMRPFIIIPTTAGTGSEVTSAAVIKNTKKNVKMLFASYRLFPNVGIIDPRMTLTVPPHITAATGMDALTHAMEAFTCLQKNPISDAYAFAAVRMISENLVSAVENGSDADTRLAMANAATMAGAAFSNSTCGMVHSLGHATGAVAHIPHGMAMSIFLPFGLEYNIEKTRASLGELLLAIGGIDEYVNTGADRRAARTIVLVRRLQEKLNDICGLPMTLKEAGVSKKLLADIAETAINDGTLTFNPEEMDLKDALNILNEAYS